MDQQKKERFSFSGSDHKLYVMRQKKTFSDYIFSENVLSEEQLVRRV